MQDFGNIAAGFGKIFMSPPLMTTNIKLCLQDKHNKSNVQRLLSIVFVVVMIVVPFVGLNAK